jgi:hypothetical protein
MHHFDGMAMALAGGLSRRAALRRAGGGLAGALLASLGLERAWGQQGAPKNCADYCKNFVGIAPGKGNAYGKCVSNCSNCQLAGGQPCGASACCTGGLVCNGTSCVQPCVPLDGDCSGDTDCCSGLCDSQGTCVSCLDVGETCSADLDCCDGLCDSRGTCVSCLGLGEPCLSRFACCSTLCSSSQHTCVSCLADGDRCTGSGQCCSFHTGGLCFGPPGGAVCI